MGKQDIHSIFKKKEEAPKGYVYVDAFKRQVKELFLIDNLELIGVDKTEVFTGSEFERYISKKRNDFLYIYYPWSNYLVKTVGPEDYFSLKTNRNQDLVTSREQKTLKDYSIAVLGLSVGSNIVLTLTQAGISNRILIADFDELDATNLNRMSGGVHQIGTKKTEIVKRKIVEDNPYAEVEIIDVPVTKENLEPFLKKGTLDAIIEEIDDLSGKIEIRKLAIKYRVPVVMVTDNGDGIVLHVERYDLGHDRIFDKPVSEWDKVDLKRLTREELGKLIVFDIVGGPELVDPRMMDSVEKVILKHLVSWPQLGSAAVLAGVAATYMIKKIALSENTDKNIRLHIHPTNN